MMIHFQHAYMHLPVLAVPALQMFAFFQDFCQLVNADQPYWLVGMTEMTRTFGLELMESILTSFPEVFLQVSESESSQ